MLYLRSDICVLSKGAAVLSGEGVHQCAKALQTLPVEGNGAADFARYLGKLRGLWQKHHRSLPAKPESPGVLQRMLRDAKERATTCVTLRGIIAPLSVNDVLC